jgi:hypothetical protein
MSYSGKQLPENPEQNMDPDHPTPLVRLTVYGTEIALLLALGSPVHDLPYGIPHDKPHTETQQPSTRIDNLRRMSAVSTNVVSSNITSFGSWFAMRSLQS